MTDSCPGSSDGKHRTCPDGCNRCLECEYCKCKHAKGKLRVLQQPVIIPWANMIEELEKLLVRAKAGELIAVSFVAQDTTDKTDSYNFQGVGSRPAIMLGELELLKAGILVSERKRRFDG